ncbi:MAG: hypothetical protein QG594_1524 [Bacteroidota bacterium]|nr:hypothetical protein [Bacteroidota bacterium]
MLQNKLYEIFWTDLANLTYEKELDFIFKKWNRKEVMNFMDLVDDFVKKIESGFILGKISKRKNIRSFVISKQTTIFFQVHEDKMEIELLLFWNNKMNPKKLPKYFK